ncbi:MAG: MFS transporter [Gemmatimonadota bacterium]|nr:MFS transporter [Gemmatimonadota bacterium]
MSKRAQKSQAGENPQSVAGGDYHYPQEKRVIIFTSVGHAMMHVFELIYAGVLPLLIIQFDLTLAQAGLLVFPNLLMLGLGSLPAGLLSDRWDSHKVFLLFFFGTSASAILIGLSVTIWQLVLAFGLMGLFASLYHPTGLAMISLGVRRKGLIMGVHGIFGSLGLAVSPFLAGLLGEMFGWQWAFFIPALAGVAIGVALLFFPIHSNRHHADRHREYAKQNNPDTAKKTSNSNNRKVLFWLYGVMIIAGFVYRGLMTYLPKYLGENIQVSWIGSSVVAGGLFVSLVLVFGGLGQIWSGHRTDRIDSFRFYVRLVPFYMPLLLVTSMLSGYPLVAGLCVFQFFFFSSQPIENQMLAQATPVRYRSTGYGLKFTLNLGIGALAAPVCGWIGDIWGMQWIFYFLSLVLVLAAAGAFGIHRAHQSAAAG